jgi:hypothetical protein
VSCEAPEVACPSGCADTASDPKNCGACGQVCSFLVGFEAVCDNGACGLVCPKGSKLCGGSCLPVQSDPKNCGDCGVNCKDDEVCSEGVCGATCGKDLTRCGNACVDLDTDRSNCGGCDQPCIELPQTEVSCEQGECKSTCLPGRGDCDGNAGNGCETDVNSSPAHCGGCGKACGSGSVCNGGVCTTGCGSGLSLCDGACINVETDVANCGACGKVCAVPSGGSAACTGGKCLSVCPAGLSLCGGSCVDTNSSLANCGGCGIACGTVCNNGVCQPPSVCGNGKTEAGEECDGFISISCSGYLKEGFGGYPKCGSDCKLDLSECQYCGNGVVDAHEGCEGSNVNGASCASLGAGTGSLKCGNCQFDLSGCTGGICGNKQGLDTAAFWPQAGGCSARPHQTTLPAVQGAWTSSAMPWQGSASEAVADSSGQVYLRTGDSIWVISGDSAQAAWTEKGLMQTPVLLPGGLAVLKQTGLTVLKRTLLALASPQTSSLQGQPTTNLVVYNGFLLHGRSDGGIYRTAIDSLSSTKLSGITQNFVGSMAIDAAKGRLYAPQKCAGNKCMLAAIDLGSGTLLWEESIGGDSTDSCHAAVGPNGVVYTGCGSSVRQVYPAGPKTSGFNVSIDSVTLPPAVASDGHSYFITRTPTGSSKLWVKNQVFKTAWSKGLPSTPLGAPLLDRDRNAYVCLKDQVLSFSPNGAQRWSIPLPDDASWCSLLMNQSGQLTVFTDKNVVRIN